jgi:hypothetical protein
VVRLRAFARAYVAALVVTSLMLPGIAGTITMILFLIGGRGESAGASDYDWLNSTGTRSWIFGTLIAIGTWMALAVLFRRYAYVDRANPSEYEKLLLGYASLRARLDAEGAGAAGPAVAVAGVHLDKAGHALGVLEPAEGPAWRWAAAVGYVGLHERLHRAEEALLALDDAAEIRAEIDFDISRLNGSRIADSRDLVKRLEAMADALKSGGDAALGADVRAGLRRIRQSVNEFRDSRRAGLVRARNNLFGTVVFTAMNAYVLLGVAMIMGAGRPQILAATVFYLVGACVGLFRQLAAAGAADTHSEEDYGLATARLIHTPLFSGLAGVGGVVLTLIALAVTPRPATAPSTPIGTATEAQAVASTSTTSTETASTPTTTTPSATTAGATTTTTGSEDSTTSNEVPSLKQIFSLDNPTAVVIAAIFGLTPGLLMSRLHSNAEKFKVDLRSTEAAETATS